MRYKLRFNRGVVWRILDALLLAGLIAYAFGGVAWVPFHGDEGMQVYATRDYLTAFDERNVNDLITHPPYTIDSRPHLRLINGSVQRYAAGWVLFGLRGHNLGDLQLEPGWNWGLNYDDNVAGGWLPKSSILMPARYISTAFFAASIVVMFALGWHLGGRLTAYLATILYALHPAVLVNARRAVMEGSLLCFGLLTLWIAAVIATQIGARRRVGLGWWIGLVLAAGFTLGSKHTGAVFLMGAWLWIFGASVIASGGAKRWGIPLRVAGQLLIAGGLAIAVFIGLSPALWSDPAARIGDLVRVRSELIEIQIAVTEDAPSPLTQRAAWLWGKPFNMGAQFFEQSVWAEATAIQAAIERYQQSLWAGLPLGWWGTPLMVVAVLGLPLMVRGGMRVPALGIGAWLLVVIVMLMANPLPWQRYYLPYLPAIILLTALSIQQICEQTRTTPSVASPPIVGQTGNKL